MRNGALILGVLLAAVSANPSGAAEDSLREGRSVNTACSPSVLVCAVLKDGSMKPIDECGARRANAARILPGDCFDAD